MPAPTVSRRRWPALAAAALTTLVASLVGIAPAAAAPTGSGPVNVLYAGSLSALMMNSVGPAFGAATGYTRPGLLGRLATRWPARSRGASRRATCSSAPARR